MLTFDQVKCDETKPHCNRCTKAKLQCEGYGIFIDVGTKKHWPSQPLVPITQEVPHPAKTFVFYRGLNGLSQLTEFENASYDFARYRTVADLSTLQCVHFWTNSVMSGCHSDPAILHAILALGAAHRTYIRKHSPESSSITDPFSSVAYTHYGKAIQHLQVRLSTNDVENYRIILIACIVLLSFDLLQERYAPALTHLQHGRSILKMLNSLTGAKGRSDLLYLPSRTQSIDEELVYSFGQIDLQSTNFGGGKPHFSFVDDPMKLDATEYSVPNVFNSIDDAGRYILIIMNDCWQLFGIVPDRKEANWSSPVAVAHQGRLLSNLRRWTQAYHRSGIKYSSANLASDPDARKSVILQIHHALITIKVGACLSFPDELVYDQFLPYYSTIVSLSEELFPNLPTFNFDMAIIQPLYSAAIHCRNPTVRRRAVEILRRSWREGLWDSKLVVIIADEVIGLEENHAGYVYDQQLDFLSDVSLADLIPAQSRIAETWMFFTDEEQTTLRTIHKRQKWTDLQNSETDSSTLYENGIAWEVIEHLVPI